MESIWDAGRCNIIVPMARHAIFEGLVVDEADQPVKVAMVGDEPCYVVDDGGFQRHISAQLVDRQVLEQMKSQIEGNEELIGQQTAKMMGQEDLFTYAMIMNQLKQMDQHMEALAETGIPENSRAYLGMLGFRVVINVHGDVVRFDQPSQVSGDEGE